MENLSDGWVGRLRADGYGVVSKRGGRFSKTSFPAIRQEEDFKSTKATSGGSGGSVLLSGFSRLVSKALLAPNASSGDAV
jgi:hypothetical protein